MMYLADNSTAANVGGAIGLVVLLAVAIGVWWLPVFIAARRHVPNVASIAIITGLAGWTLIGYVVALAMAFRDLPPVPPPPYNYGPPPGYVPGYMLPPPPPSPTGTWAQNVQSAKPTTVHSQQPIVIPDETFGPPRQQPGFRPPDNPR